MVTDIRHRFLKYQALQPRWLLLITFLLVASAATSFLFTVFKTSSPACQLLVAPSVLPSSNEPEGYCWALIGNDGTHLAEERSAGVMAKVFSLSWRNYAFGPEAVDEAYVQRKREELEQLRRAGFDIILGIGFHDTPTWLHERYPDSHYVNQFGERYQEDLDAGDANLVFNTALRELVTNYMQQVFADFGTDFAAVRLGGGRYGELTYPPARFGDRRNSYWAFDRNGLALSPVPDWVPGEPSPNGEAQLFLDWYHGALVEYQNWQIATVRQNYAGPIMMLYPSWGIRPGDIEEAIASNLDGSTSAERNGEIQRGFDFARQIAALTDPRVIITTTWLDADASRDDEQDPRYWSPVKYLASLAEAHPLGLRMYGENTGQGHLAALELSALQMRRYRLLGMAWYREDELFSGEYATLEDYERVITPTR